MLQLMVLESLMNSTLRMQGGLPMLAVSNHSAVIVRKIVRELLRGMFEFLVCGDIPMKMRTSILSLSLQKGRLLLEHAVLVSPFLHLGVSPSPTLPLPVFLPTCSCILMAVFHEWPQHWP